MLFTLIMIAANTAFWVGLHFGTAFAFTSVPRRYRERLFAACRAFFRVSQVEMRFYRKIRLPEWKDRLPQYNRDFDKRGLPAEVTEGYLLEYRFITCQAEAVHYLIAALGYLSLLFCLACERPARNLPLFFGIATALGLCNFPFAMVQRYNRCRLDAVLARLRRTNGRA
ncbi:hypothetical protein LI291_03745 [Intestinibacillus massiliensis]|nr:hypothetical protein [Intestinibacillus massiliensis]